jgi:hypothetical protein
MTARAAAPPAGAPEALAARVAQAVARATAALPSGTDARLERLSVKLPIDAGAAEVAVAVRAALAEATEEDT